MAMVLMENLATLSIDLNARSYAGKTAFIEACAGGHADVAKVLMENSTFLGIDLNAKSNINAKSKIGSTAFHEYYSTRILEVIAYVSLEAAVSSGPATGILPS